MSTKSKTRNTKRFALLCTMAEAGMFSTRMTATKLYRIVHFPKTFRIGKLYTSQWVAADMAKRLTIPGVRTVIAVRLS